MKMSVYRQRTPRTEMEHGNCMRGSKTMEDIDLVELALATEKPVLMGLEGKSTIIKLFQEGDDALSFEALYDTCLTLTDLRNMKRAGVDKPEDVPEGKYRLEMIFRLEAELDMRIVLTAGDHGNVRKRFADLMRDDPEFRDQLFDQLTKAFRQQDGGLLWAIRDTQRVDLGSPGTELEFAL